MRKRSRSFLFARPAAACALGAACLLLLVGSMELALKAAGFVRGADPRFGPLSAGCCVPDAKLIWRLRAEDERSSIGRNAPPKRPGVARILAVGDSSTYGIGVERGETYAELLERKLEREAGAGRFEVINAGTPGYSSWQGLGLLKEAWPAYEPDVLILYFGSNDAAHTRYPDDERQLGWKVRARFRLMKLRGYRWFDEKWRARRREAALRRLELPRELRVSPDRFRGNLLEMLKLARSRGARTLLLAPPCSLNPSVRRKEFASLDDYVQRLCRERLPEYRRIVREVAERTGTPFIDLPRFLPEDSGAGLFADPIHPGPEGHRRIAEAIYRHLAKSAAPGS